MTRMAAAEQGRHHWQVQSRDEREVIGDCWRDVAAKSFCAIDKEREHGWRILPLPFANVFLSRQLSFITSSSLFDLSFIFRGEENERDERQMSINTRTPSSRLWRRWLFQLTGAQNKTKNYNFSGEKLRARENENKKSRWFCSISQHQSATSYFFLQFFNEYLHASRFHHVCMACEPDPSTVDPMASPATLCCATISPRGGWDFRVTINSQLVDSSARFLFFSLLSAVKKALTTFTNQRCCTHHSFLIYMLSRMIYEYKMLLQQQQNWIENNKKKLKFLKFVRKFYLIPKKIKVYNNILMTLLPFLIFTSFRYII
jgi:hypothetical protein